MASDEANERTNARIAFLLQVLTQDIRFTAEAEDLPRVEAAFARIATAHSSGIPALRRPSRTWKQGARPCVSTGRSIHAAHEHIMAVDGRKAVALLLEETDIAVRASMLMSRDGPLTARLSPALGRFEGSAVSVDHRVGSDRSTVRLRSADTAEDA
jgi:hypothetical protein